MILDHNLHILDAGRILHVCGDDPIFIMISITFKVYSPRMWRWSYLMYFCSQWYPVFSTYVEMILAMNGRNFTFKEYSPRMWRWSCARVRLLAADCVFSTYVEMILPYLQENDRYLGILHVCGDDPISVATNLQIFGYSPRMWRWSYTTRHWREK